MGKLEQKSARTDPRNAIRSRHCETSHAAFVFVQVFSADAAKSCNVIIVMYCRSDAGPERQPRCHYHASIYNSSLVTPSMETSSVSNTDLC